jgi:hypothetical protein
MSLQGNGLLRAQVHQHYLPSLSPQLTAMVSGVLVVLLIAPYVQVDYCELTYNKRTAIFY